MAVVPIHEVKKIYYGWILLGATAFSGFILAGVGFTFSLFILPMQRELGWSITTIAAAMGVRSVVSGLGQPLSGALVSRYGPKKVIVFGLALLGISTTLMFTVQYVWHYYLQFGIASTLGVTMGAAGPMSAMVARWFRKRRTLTLAISRVGGSAGQLVLVPAVTFLLLPHGWRTSYVVMGAVVLAVLVPLSIIVLKDDPSEKGLLPDGERPAPGSPPTAVVTKGAWAKARAATSGQLNIGLRQAARTRTFWLLSAGFFVCGFTSVGIQMVYLVPYAVLEVGISEATAGVALGVMGGAGVLGIMTSGYLGDKIGKKIPLGGIYLGRGLSFLLMAHATDEWQVFVAAAVMGFSFIATVPLVMAIVADNYGTISMALVYGTVFAVHQAGGAIGNVFGGRIMDFYGTLDPAWLIGAATLLVAATASFMVREHRAPRAALVRA